MEDNFPRRPSPTPEAAPIVPDTRKPLLSGRTSAFEPAKRACAAVQAIAEGRADAGVAAAMAKSYVCGAAVDVVGKAMQLHGGIGYTWESGIHIYLKRAALNRSLFGSPAAHRSAKSLKCALSGEPDCPGAFNATDRFQSSGSDAIANGP